MNNSIQIPKEVIEVIKKKRELLQDKIKAVAAEAEFILEELSDKRKVEQELKNTLIAYTNFLNAVETAEEANNE